MQNITTLWHHQEEHGNTIQAIRLISKRPVINRTILQRFSQMVDGNLAAVVEIGNRPGYFQQEGAGPRRQAKAVGNLPQQFLSCSIGASEQLKLPGDGGIKVDSVFGKPLLLGLTRPLHPAANH